MDKVDKHQDTDPLSMVVDSHQLGDEQFQEIIYDSFKPLVDLNRIKPYHSRDNNAPAELIQTYNLGEMDAFRLRFQSLMFKRGKERIGKNELDDFYILATYKSGCVHVTADQHMTLNPGDSILCNLEKPFSGHVVDGFDGYNIVIPKQALSQYGVDLNGKGCIFLPGSSLPGAMIGGAVLKLGETLDQASAEEKLTASNTLASMLSQVISPTSIAEDSPVAQSATLASVMEYIENHLHDPALGIDQLVKVFHRSRATIYRLFESEGGILAYIQRRRLHACYKELTTEAAKPKRIIDLAVKWGFNNHSHFTRVFREHYEITPSNLYDAASAQELNHVNQKAQDYINDIHRKSMWMYYKN